MHLFTKLPLHKPGLPPGVHMRALHCAFADMSILEIFPRLELLSFDMLSEINGGSFTVCTVSTLPYN
jgi:hypothetical protein